MQDDDVRNIPFENLPGFSPLFLSYLRLSPEILRFYQHAPSLQELHAAAQRSRPAPRAEVTKVLRRQNRHFGSSPAAMAAIERLEQRGSVAIVTGQQLGLFGGPLYTVYKALTAARLSELLTSSGVPSAPVFWMEGEDHDLAEAVGPELATSWNVPEGTSVRSVRLPDGIGQTVRSLADSVPESPEKARVIEILSSAYEPHASMADAFGRLMAQLLAPFGIVLFDPGDTEAKSLTVPLMRRALSGARQIRGLIASRDGELRAAGFHTQVTLGDNSTTLFYRPAEQRRALVISEAGFALRGGLEQWTEADLERRLLEAPERFSPNVLLRPVVQDTLFPTAAYVAGPAEIAYFAQVAPLHRFFDVPMPLIWPRASMTLLEPEVARLLHDAGLTFEDCVGGDNLLIERMLQRQGKSLASEKLRDYSSELEQALEALRPGLLMAEASLGAALDTAKRKMLHNLESLGARFVQAEAQRNEELTARARYLSKALRPEGNYQEREITVVPFLARHGSPLMEKLHSAADPHIFAHRIVALT